MIRLYAELLRRMHREFVMTTPYRVFMFLLCISLPVLAQQSPAQNETGAQAETMSSPSHESHITLAVVVTDRSGKPVAGLKQQDFTVFDNKKPQQIVAFRAVQQDATTVAPLAKVILLVDEVNTSYDSVAYERDQIKKFLLQNEGKLAQPISLVFFSEKGTVVQDGSTRDGKSLLAAFDANQNGLRTIRRAQGYWGATERYQLSLATLSSLTEREGREPGRKLLVWISPGWPLLSGPNVDLSRAQGRAIFSSVVRISTALRLANVTLYAINPLGSAVSISRENYYENFLKGVPSANQVESANLALQVLSVQSGGQVLYASNDIASLIARAVQDASAYYMLSVETPPAEHADEYHAIQVTVAGLKARTRTGYYAQP
jgi:VWFA-related protein